MDRLEWRNTLDLLKLRLTELKGLKWVWIFVPILFAGKVIGDMIAVINNKNFGDMNTGFPSDYYLAVWDPSSMISFIVLAWVLAMTGAYRTYNRGIDVYPQTNTSRFLSLQLLFIIVIVYSGIVCLLLNLLEYAIYSVLSSGHADIVILNSLSPAGQLSGFLLYLLFLLFQTAVISLIASLVRRYRYIALVGLIAALAYLVFILIMQVQIIDPTNFSVLERYRTSPFTPFIILAVCLLMFVGTLYINKHIVYYRTNRSKFSAAFPVIAIFCFLIAISPVTIIGGQLYPRASGIDVSDFDEIYLAPENRDKIVIDASAYPRGSKLNIVSTNFSDASSEESTISNPMNMNLWYERDELDHFEGKKITVNVRYPLIIYNGYNISEAMHPKVTAKLEGDTLLLDYNYTKARPLILPCWSMMLNSGGSGGGTTVISVS
jgi:hypothetical protein